ncbi:MAG: glycosyltransferase [Gammaproteobacteria bacterium]|nr:glycosyltransferase [Gammaproteobacteria bacterium]MBU1481682.1 glycosyltransferase [Gammaproteobacteria bacterium]
MIVEAPDIPVNSPPEGGKRTRGNLKRSLPGKPLLTVITVVFNGAETLEHTLCSVMEQTYKNIEHIVIDGGSSDATLDILRKYDSHIDYWVSEKDAGIYDAMNKGIALASGDFIGMLNSDDYFAGPNAMETIVANLKASNADAVFSNLDIVDPANPSHVLRKYRISRLTPFMLRIGVMPPHPTFYCKKSCYEKAGLYRTDYRIAADFEMLTRLLITHHITWQFIDETTVKMRSGGLSTSGIKANWVVNREITRACMENGLYTNMFMLVLKLPIRLMERIL